MKERHLNRYPVFVNSKDMKDIQYEVQKKQNDSKIMVMRNMEYWTRLNKKL